MKSHRNGIYNLFFEHPFIRILEVLLIVIDAIMTIISPFLSIVSGLLSDVGTLIYPIILSTIAPNSKEDNKNNNEVNLNKDTSFENNIANFLIDFDKKYSKSIAIAAIVISIITILATYIAWKIGWIDSVGKAIGLGILSLILSTISYGLIFTDVENLPNSTDDSEKIMILGLSLSAGSAIVAVIGISASIKGKGSSLMKLINGLLNSVALILAIGSYIATLGQYANRPKP